MRTAICMVFLSLLLAICSAARLKRQLNPEDRELFKQMITDALQQLQTTSQTIPDISGQSGKVQYMVRNITLHDLRLPQMDVVDAGPSSLRLSLSGLGVAASANWNITFVTKFFPLRSSGSIFANITGVSVTVTATVEDLGDGRIKVSLTQCQSTVDSLEIRMTGALSVFFHPFKSVAENRLRTLIPEKICSQVREYIIKV